MNEWQPVRIAPISSLNPEHEGELAEDYSLMVGKIVRVRVAEKTRCGLGCVQYEVHPEDRKLITLDDQGLNVFQFCIDQLQAD